MKKTKILCTLGPASDNKEVLEKMIKAGMNAVRLNFSHGNHEDYKKLIKTIKSIRSQQEQPLGIIQDLQGAKRRIGILENDQIEITKNKTYKFSTKKTNDTIHVAYKYFYDELKKNTEFLVDDGTIRFIVIKKGNSIIHTKALDNGILRSRKGINVIGMSSKMPAITNKDKEDLKFGVKEKVDYIALSFVQNANDVFKLKKLIEKEDKYSPIKIISKIESSDAIKNIEEIIQASDAIMVARGDLALEIGPENVPLAQKQITKLCQLHAKPVIIATQMLSSMVTNPIPSRAEVNDTANNILDMADCLMLSNETSVGMHPVKCVKTLTDIAKKIEPQLNYLPNQDHHNYPDKSKALTKNAVELADESNAALIVGYTNHGTTSKLISSQRPNTDIVIYTGNKDTKHQQSLVWGINKVILNKRKYIKTDEIIRDLNNKKIVKKKEKVIYCANNLNKNIIAELTIT